MSKRTATRALSTEDKGLILEAIVDAGLNAIQSPDREDFEKWLALLNRLARLWTSSPVRPAIDCLASHAASDPDSDWINECHRKLKDIQRDGFNKLVASNEVRAVMTRLRKERPFYFEVADRMFATKHRKLPGDFV